MSRADEIRARSQRFTAAATTEPTTTTALTEVPRPDDDPTARPLRRPPRTEPVRSTVDLPPAHHRKLNEWADETAWQLGRKRITRQAVLSALVARLLTDETLARKITADLAATDDA